jgi:hypothetical protein
MNEAAAKLPAAVKINQFRTLYPAHLWLFCNAKSNCLEYILFVAYLILFVWLVTRTRFFNRSGLSQSQLIIIFLLKVMAGIFYGWIGIYYSTMAQMSDTWNFHNLSIPEYKLLLHDPLEFFNSIFYNPYEGGFEKFFNASNSYWNDLKGNAFIKLLSIFNLFSFGNYYVNVIFFSFISLFGPIAIYRIMSSVFNSGKLPLLIGCFLVPSFLYWGSGLHKEGMIVVGISLVIYHTYFGLQQKRFGIGRIAAILLGLFLLLIFRNFVLVVILPALLALVVASYFPKRGLLIFSSLYIIFIILFFTVRYIDPQIDFPKAVVTKQQEFLKLQEANSTIPIRELEPTALSFLQNTPQAFSLAVLRPYPSDVRHILSLAAAVEVCILLLIFIAFLFFRRQEPGSPVFVYFCVFFSISLLLAIGLSNNNLGAIVRYRSIILPLLVTPMLAQINWKKFSFNGIQNKINA